MNLLCLYFYPRSPCGERQKFSCIAFQQSKYFYPRSPCGERLIGPVSFFNTFPFLSTLSLRRATSKRYQVILGNVISIHALLAESDLIALFDFPIVPAISIHALLAESDVTVLGIQHRAGISIHALLAESDLKTPCVKLSIEVFLSTLSLRRATLFYVI